MVIASDISASFALLNLLGAVALLLWGLRMVSTAASRTFGVGLRRMLNVAMASRLRALGFGAATAVVMQSSTAAVMMVADFTGRGFASLGAGLAAALGADLGSAASVMILSFDLSALIPVLAIMGYLLFKRSSVKQWRSAGRGLIGLSIVLLALQLIFASTGPMRESTTLATVFTALADEPMLALLVAGLTTWVAHSSLAMVLLIGSLLVSGILSGPVALILIFGVNIGAALPALVTNLSAPAAAKNVTVGNLIFRIFGALLAVSLVDEIYAVLVAEGVNDAMLAPVVHLGFNIALCLFVLPFTGVVAAILTRLSARPAQLADDISARYLSLEAQKSPSRALAAASRECARLGDFVYDMMRLSRPLLEAHDPAEVGVSLSLLDDQVDALNREIKFFLADLRRTPMSAREAERAMAIFDFVTNLEHIGDIVDRDLRRLAQRKHKQQLSFSDDGKKDIIAMHDQIVRHLEQALSAFQNMDEELAELLIAEKRVFREAERATTHRHLDRLSDQNPESLASSGLHIDLMRDLRRVQSHIIAIAHVVARAPR
ncbi:MAG: Na/Pi cotransporter family protein [Pikeienuella sp.]